MSTLPPAPILEAGSLDVDDASRGIGRGILASHPLPLPCLFSDAALVAYSLSIARSDAHLSDGIFAAGSTLHGHVMLSVVFVLGFRSLCIFVLLSSKLVILCFHLSAPSFC